MELRSVSVSIQVGGPENICNPFGIVKMSQLACEISQVPVSFDAIPDAQGCPCVSMEVHMVRSTFLLVNSENIGIATGIDYIFVTAMLRIIYSSFSRFDPTIVDFHELDDDVQC